MEIESDEEEADLFSHPELALLIARGNDLLARLDAWLPPAPPRIDWKTTWPAAGASRTASACWRR
jgi:hypothetical protein